jgi:hypothetical protein
MRHFIILAFGLVVAFSSFAQFRNFVPANTQPNLSTPITPNPNKDLVESFRVNYKVSDEQFHNLLLNQSRLWQILPQSVLSDPNNLDSSVVSAFVVVDSLLDYFAGFSVDRSMLTALKIDSITFQVGHQSTSGGISSFGLKIIELNNQNYPLGNVWVNEQINTGQGLSPGNNWKNTTTLTFKPAFYLPPPFRFAAQLTYQGAAQDTFGLVAGFSADGACIGNLPKAVKSAFYPNSLAYIKKFNTLIPTSAGSDIYYDCNQNQQYDTLSDGNNLIQNWDVTFYFTKHTTGIESNAAVEAFMLYPNPANGFFNINPLTIQESILKYRILNLQGKVLSQNIIPGRTVSHIVLSDGMASGLYVVEIQSANNTYRQKLIVSKSE